MGKGLGLAPRGSDHRKRRGRRARGPSLVDARFIAFEGLDGSGKTTQAALFVDALRARGHEVVQTREPGGTDVGEQIRDLVLSFRPGTIGLAAEAQLFAAARSELVREVIAPALARGQWVVSDRFIDSSLAYQGAARGLGIDAVLRLNEIGIDGLFPHRAVVIDVPLETAAARRSAASDRIEAEGARFHAAVGAGYRLLAERFPERVVAVHGAGTPDEVHVRVLAKLEQEGLL